jgi:hypothetical protein
MKSVISILFILPFIISAQAPDTAWTKNFGVEDYYDGGYSVQQTYDGGYIIAGYTTRINGTAHYDVYLIKTDSLGDSLWARTYDNGIGLSGQQTIDSGYIITGTSGSDVYLIKTDSNGDSL